MNTLKHITAVVMFLASCTPLFAPACSFGSALPPTTPPPTECTSGQHVWNGYHLAHDALEPVVVNDSVYAPDLDAWNALGTQIRLRPAGVGFTITVQEGGDASSGWLGLASVRVDSGGHIRSAAVTMNRTLLAKYGPSVADHVLCQELGHLLGLDHQRNADDSCMDDCQGRGAGWLACISSDAGTTPNPHDAEQLRAIYEHVGPAPPPPSCSVGGEVRVHAFPVEAADADHRVSP